MGRGDHIYVNYSVYSHHGIDCGDGTVIHYRKINATISRTSWDEFANEKDVFLKEYDKCDPPDVVIRRAESRLGEKIYDVGSNNCEHFATWCKTGIHTSEQVNNAVVQGAAAGSVAGLSAAGITSGLAAVGATVGGGMAAGVAVTVAAPAVAAAAVGYGAYRFWKWLSE